MLRSFLKDSVIYAVPSVISKGISFLLIPLYTRVLSPQDFGSFDLLLVFASVINLTIALEISQGIGRFLPPETNHNRRILLSSSAFWFTFFSYGLFAITSLAFSSNLASLIMGQEALKVAFQAGVLYILFNGIFYFIQNQLRWELRSRDYALVSLLMTVITAIASILLTFIFRFGLIGLLLSMVIGCFTASIVGLFLLRNSFRLSFSSQILFEMLAYSAPLVLSGIAVWITLYIDRIMINYFLSLTDVGIYGMGYRIASISGLVMVGFQGALSPLIFANYKRREAPRQLEQIFRIFLAVALTLFLLLTLFATDILAFFATPKFYGASSVVILLVPAIILSNMYIFAPGISIAKKTYLIVVINVFGGIINLVLNCLLIPAIGIVGAGTATLISYFMIFIAYTFIGQHYYYIPFRWKVVASAAIFAALFASLSPLFQLPIAMRWIFNLLLVLLFLIVLIVIRLISPHEIAVARQLLLSRLPPFNRE